MVFWKKPGGAPNGGRTETEAVRETDWEYVRGNEGSRIICAAVRDLFRCGRRTQGKYGPLYPVVKESSVALCCLGPGEERPAPASVPGDRVVWEKTFDEIYREAGAEGKDVYHVLSSKGMRWTLEGMIREAVSTLPYIKDTSIGFQVLRFGNKIFLH